MRGNHVAKLLDDLLPLTQLLSSARQILTNLGKKDAALLARRKVNVVHCPRSHAYFRHDKFPFAGLSRARVNVCLGTDSLASVRKIAGRTPELNMFTEMQAFASAAPDVSPATILKMATANAARALGRKGQFGEISRHAAADLIVLPFNDRFANVYEAVLHHAGDVLASMIDGHWALEPAVN